MGTRRSASLAAVSATPGSRPPATAKRTGNSAVNQPTVRERSWSASSSWRPWPSTSITTSCRRVHRASTAASAAATTSCGRARYRRPALPSRARVSSAFSVIDSTAAAPSLASPVGSSSGIVPSPLAAARQPGSSAASSSERAYAVMAAAYAANGVGTGSRTIGSPRAACRYPARRSSSRIPHDTASTARWWATRTSRAAAGRYRARTSGPRSRSSAGWISAAAAATSPVSATTSNTSAVADPAGDTTRAWRPSAFAWIRSRNAS
nr:hypothetical protein [uncultured bacterium]